MIIDILHQLLQKMTMYLINWIKVLLKAKMSIFKKRKSATITLLNTFEIDQLNARFNQIFSFIDLKRFAHFSKIKQSTEMKQKTIIKEIISMITSLLSRK